MTEASNTPDQYNTSYLQDLEPVRKSYAEMLEIAKKLSPEARLRLDSSGIWEIYLSTDYAMSLDLPESYRDTPAWLSHLTPDPGRERSCLEAWASRNGIKNMPIEAMADYLNQEERAQDLMQAELEKLNTETGVDTSDWNTVDEAGFEQYEKNRDSVEKQFREQFTNERKVLETKWGSFSKAFNNFFNLTNSSNLNKF